jgi:hypothetical protein
MIERIKEVLLYGDPSTWSKTKENQAKVKDIEKVWRDVFNNKKDMCGWCARVEMVKHLTKYLKGNGHL